MIDTAGRAWIERVLGFKLDEGVSRKPLLPIWAAAKDEVDGQLNSLRSVLESYKHPDLHRIAEYGLYGVTERSTVALMAALRDADASAGNDAARQKLAGVITRYRADLDENRGVQLIDRNPFGVSVGLRQRLGDALAEIERQLAA